MDFGVIKSEILRVSFDKILESCQEMVNLVGVTFGPRGQLVMVVKQNNSVYLTSNCVDLMRSTPKLNFISEVIKKTVIRHHSRFGDGSKTLLLILNEMLKEIKLILSKDKVEINLIKATLIRELIDVQNELNFAFEEIREKPYCSVVNEENFNLKLDLIKKVIKTFFNGKFSSLISGILSEKLFQFISGYLNIKGVNLNFVDENFYLLSCEINGLSVNETQIISGLILKRKFVVYPPSFKFKRQLKLICVIDELNFNSAEIISSAKNNSQEIMIKTFQYTQSLRNFFADLIRINVNLIVIKGNPSENFVKSCEKLELALISTNMPEEFEFILNFNQINAINLNEINQINSCCVLKAVKPIIIANNQWINLEFEKPLFSLIISGGNCQYLQECQNGVKLCKSLWRDNKLYSYPSNATWEIDLAKILIKFNCSNSLKSALLISLGKSLMSIPSMLFQNSNQINSRYLTVELKLIKSLSSLMINEETGEAVNINLNQLESLIMKENCLIEVISLIIQLLRLDLIIY